MKVLVTGGGGFIGRAVIPLLSVAGHQIVATSRSAETVIAGAEVRKVGELGPETDWSEALNGIEAVIHLAARVHVMNESGADPVSENRRINTEGTRKLSMEAARAGIRHFVFLSTIKVNGEASGTEPFRADDVAAPADPYAVAKMEAELALLEITANSTMRASIIRPPLVYGPGVRGNFLSLLGLCRKGWPLPVGAIKNRRSLIYVGNLANLILCLLDTPKDTPGVYLCRDGADVSTPELFRQIGASLGRSPILLPVPSVILRLAGTVTGKSATISRLTESLAVDDGPTRHDLDWTPPFSMLQGLRETAIWFKSRDEC